VTLYKKGAIKEPGNYRLISVQNTLIKIYEKFLYIKYKKRVMKALQPFQKGAIEDNSTLSIVRRALQKAEGKVAVFFDFKEAFDRV